MTIIDPDELPKGIAFVQHKMNEAPNEKGLYDRFWRYFQKTWIDGYGFKQWNIHAIVSREDKDDIMINRTNNPLERYNRTFQDNFPHPHPSMTDFVRVIRSQGQEYWNLYEDVRKKRRISPKHAIATVPTIPPHYYGLTTIVSARCCRERILTSRLKHVSIWSRSNNAPEQKGQATLSNFYEPKGSITPECWFENGSFCGIMVTFACSHTLSMIILLRAIVL